MDANDFQRMFEYDSWANRECIAAMRAADPNPSDLLGRMAHILASQTLWLERLLGQPQSMPVWPTSTIDECAALADETRLKWRNYLTNRSPETSTGNAASSLHENVKYRNTKGEPWSSRVEDVLIHVLFHSAYHRGQIALQMRASGLTPAYTDFIHAVRQGFVD
jgi:uncharacterized damage-inducible protein DinB